ncbi:uncharacterized protein LOC129301938 [Prosopis cineraria]|uniref:uncharacterized protein LOC129301938 n=1 Tax=Prosopis cineraria TaxID=364024 RepID=UPI00240FC7F7|nr:uncharacterized protein LOC129301938 [Prosopis cineraria]
MPPSLRPSLYLISLPINSAPSTLPIIFLMDAPSFPQPPLERKPSIDSEPKTLLHHEMKLAREAALKIMTTHSREEALKIFLAGLVPVKIPKQAEEDVVASDGDES